MTPEAEALFSYLADMPSMILIPTLFLGFFCGLFFSYVCGLCEELRYILREFRHRKRLEKSSKELEEAFENVINRQDG